MIKYLDHWAEFIFIKINFGSSGCGDDDDDDDVCIYVSFTDLWVCQDRKYVTIKDLLNINFMIIKLL